MILTTHGPRRMAGLARCARTFLADRSGAVAIEYGILAVMIAAFLISVAALGDTVLTHLFERVASHMFGDGGGGGSS
jgi:Flp pilus assembly protein, pilin Flp